MNKPSVKDFKMTMHMALSNQHILAHEGTIVWEGNPINKKKIFRQVVTPKSRTGNFGKAKVFFFIEGDSKKEFETAAKLFEHYKVPEKPKQREHKIKIKIKPEALAKRKAELKNL